MSPYGVNERLQENMQEYMPSIFPVEESGQHMWWEILLLNHVVCDNWIYRDISAGL